jgi:hypothetical protein
METYETEIRVLVQFHAEGEDQAEERASDLRGFLRDGDWTDPIEGVYHVEDVSIENGRMVSPAAVL